MSEPSERKIWFPAKRYGCGWGLPIAWQGWVVYALFIGFIWLGEMALLPQPHRHIVAFVAYVLVLVCILVAICKYKGEPTKWRWGNK